MCVSGLCVSCLTVTNDSSASAAASGPGDRRHWGAPPAEDDLGLTHLEALVGAGGTLMPVKSTCRSLTLPHDRHTR